MLEAAEGLNKRTFFSAVSLLDRVDSADDLTLTAMLALAQVNPEVSLPREYMAKRAISSQVRLELLNGGDDNNWQMILDCITMVRS